jgi:Chromate transporter
MAVNASIEPAPSSLSGSPVRSVQETSKLDSPAPMSRDIESQTQDPKAVVDVSSSLAPPAILAASEDDAGFEDNSRVPRLSIPRLFWFFFYNFGLFAWGGPVAQIALIKDRLVFQDKWITLQRFQRVFAVYQILPGPEAAELCMFFGCLSAGRLGGIVAGLAFILPGFVLMLVASYVYSLAGFDNKYFNASFRALQPIVAAMVRDPHTTVPLYP